MRGYVCNFPENCAIILRIYRLAEIFICPVNTATVVQGGRAIPFFFSAVFSAGIKTAHMGK